ncbi:MAG: hypothetical protein ACJ75B_20740 [Flavisolibacter sp.]
MKNFALHIFIVSFFFSLSVQAQKKPTQAEMNKMMKEAQKEIDELEKEDPEAAKVARQMMGQMQDKENKTVKPATGTASKTSSPITPISLKGPVSLPSKGQDRDRLLCFKGKRINDSMLITADGKLVLISNKKNQLVVQPNTSSDPFQPLVKELMKSEERNNQFIDQVAHMKNAAFLYPSIINTLKEFNLITARYRSLVKNTIGLPPLIIRKNIQKNGKGVAAPNDEALIDIDKQIQEAHDAVMAKKDAAPQLNVAPPPSREEDVCFDCDFDKQQTEYEESRKNWDSGFLSYERELTGQAINVQRMIELLAGNDDTASYSNIRGDMDEVIRFCMDREEKAVAMLEDQYSKDFKKLPIVIEAILSIAREQSLLGTTDKYSSEAMERISGYVGNFDDFLQHEMDNRNYNLVFNLPFIIGMERQKQLLGISDDHKIDYLDQLQAFNRFKLTIDIDFKEEARNSDGEITMDATGKLSNQKEVFVSLGRLGCKYQLYLTNTVYGEADEKEYRIPLEVKEGLKRYRNSDGNGYTTMNYSGPKLMYLIFPVFKIDFCDQKGEDSAYMQMPVYEEDLSPWGTTVKNAYTIDMMGFLGHMFFNLAGIEGKTADATAIGNEMIKALTTREVDEPTGNSQLDELQANYNKSKQLNDQQTKMAQLAIHQNLLFLFDAHNNSSTLLDGSTDAARPIADRLKLVKGVLNIKVVHDPRDYIPKKLRKPLKKVGS